MTALLGRLGDIILAWVLWIDVTILTAGLSILYFFKRSAKPIGDETISGYVGWCAIGGARWALTAESVINTVLFWDPDHCRRIFASRGGRR